MHVISLQFYALFLKKTNQGYSNYSRKPGRMQAISFYLLYPLIRLFSFIPLRILYFISDFLVYPVLYGLLGYRKKVVRENMRRVYPEKTEEERLAIEKRFYHYLSDLFMETVKGFNISYEELDKRIEIVNPEVIREIYGNHKGIVLTTGHVGNYEWLGQYFPAYIGLPFLAPYRKFTNPYFDHFFKTTREKGGAWLFHTHVTQHIVRSEKGKYLLALANDQSAPAEKSYWVKFLNQDTSFFEGTEKLARQLDFPVVYINIGVAGRGKYELTFHTITVSPLEEEIGFIMKEHARLLEDNIHQAPEYWLWSHKRWKHKKPEGFGYGFTRDILK